MFVLVSRNRLVLWSFGILMFVMGLSLFIQGTGKNSWVVSSGKYKVFVSGVGTVEGVWAEKLGIALIGLQTKPAPEPDRELKYIDVLVANAGDEPIVFNPDFTLTDKKGSQYVLTSDGQPQAEIKPGTMSQGTVIIDVPKGIKDEDLTLEIKGGCLPQGVVMPLKVSKVNKNIHENHGEGEHAQSVEGN